MHHLKGKLHRITNIAKFLKNPSQPDPTSFKPIVGASVLVDTTLVPGLEPFFKAPSFDATTGTDGSFDIKIPESFGAIAPTMIKNLHVSAFNGLNIAHIGPLPLPMPRWIYRSAPFALAKLDNQQNHNLFCFSPTLGDNDGITQEMVDKQIAPARKKIGAQTLSGFIVDSGVHIRLERDGSTVKFDLALRPTASSNLHTFLDSTIVNLDIDRPGPDFITEICESDESIRKEYIQPGIDNVMVDFNKQVENALIHELAQAVGQPDNLVKQVFNSQATLTFEKLRFPVVKVTHLPGSTFTVKQRNIVPVPSIGFPRTVL